MTQKTYWLIEQRHNGQPMWAIIVGFRLAWTVTATSATRFDSAEDAAIERSEHRESMPDETFITQHADVS